MTGLRVVAEANAVVCALAKQPKRNVKVGQQILGLVKRIGISTRAQK
jgi:hypothetical protein